MFNKRLRYFPPPKFLDIPFSGLYISDIAIHCIKFRRRGKELAVEKYIERSIPPGLITAGQVNNKDEFVGLLKQLAEELGLDYVKVSLPEEKAYLFTAKIPIVHPKEVKAAIETKIEENVPVPPGELLYDYKLVDTTAKDHLGVVVSALPISVIEMYVDVITSAGLSLLSLEIESQAISRALLSPSQTETVLIVHFGPEKVGLYVVENRIVHFTSTVLTKGEGRNNPDFLSHEIKKLDKYWSGLKENIDKPEKKITSIILCGEKFQDSTVSYLSLNHEAKVSVGNVWINAFDINTSIPELPFVESLKYAGAVGLALPSDILI